MMSENKMQSLSAKPNEKLGSKKLNLTAGGCAVTLNFPAKAQGALMTEVKRMILSGHAHMKM
jgi:hypothetical protein